MIRDGTHSIPTICSKNEILQGGKEHILTDPGKDLKLIWKSFFFLIIFYLYYWNWKCLHITSGLIVFVFC